MEIKIGLSNANLYYNVKSKLFDFWLTSSCWDKDPLHLEISPFVHFMVQILFHKSNGLQSVSSFKILNDMVVCILFDLGYLI